MTQSIAACVRCGIAGLIGLGLSAATGAQAAEVDGPVSRPVGTQPSPPPTVGELVAQLSSPDWRKRRNASAALATLGPEAEAELRTIAETGKLDDEARANIERLLQEFQEKRRVGATPVTLHARAVPAAEAFESVLAQAKLKLTPQSASLLKNARAIDLDVERKPVWEALLDLCARSGVAFYAMDKDGSVDLTRPDAGHAAPPCAASGPFVLTIARVLTVTKRSEDFAAARPTNGIMNNERGLEPCRMYVYAWAEPRLKPLRWYIDSVDVGPTDNGQKISPDRATGHGAWGGGTINDSQASSIVLDGSFEGARRLQSLRVMAHFALELERQHLEIPDVLTVHNGVYDLAGYRLTIKGVNKVIDDRYSYEYSIFRDGRSPADWQVMQTMVTARLVDAQGKRLNMTSGGGSYGPNEIQSTQNVTTGAGGGIKTGEPARLVFDVPSKVEQRPAVFEFKDVPLPQ